MPNYFGLPSQSRNYGLGLSLPATQNGPVRRNPTRSMVGQFEDQDEATALAQSYPDATPEELQAMAQTQINSHNQARADEFASPALGVSMPEHRRAGGSERRTRSFAQQQPVYATGGPGAAPAMPGRIGYRGRLGGPQESGLDWLQRGRTQSILNEGARREIDPVTGLPVNATPAEIAAQINMLAGQGDEQGLEGSGLGGSRRAQSIADYYTARAGGDPDAIAAATQGVQGLKRNINTLRTANTPQMSTSKTATGTASAGIGSSDAPVAGVGNASQTLGQSVPPPMSQAPTSTPPASNMSVPGITPAIPGRKMGGSESDVHPYIVNEEGMESVLYNGDKMPHLIPGGEHMTTFQRSGRVIPHRRTMQMMQEGNMMMPEHLEKGGDTQASHRSFPHIFPLRSRIGRTFEGLGRGASSIANRGVTAIGDALRYPFEQEPLSNDQIGVGDVSTPQMGNPMPVRQLQKIFPVQLPVVEPPPEEPEEGSWLDDMLGNIQNHPIPVNPNAGITQAMMGNRGVNTMAPPQAGGAAFTTPYGTASVIRPPTLVPHAFTGPHVFNADGTPWNGQPLPATPAPINEMTARDAYATQQLQDKLYPENSAPIKAQAARNKALVDKFADDDRKALGSSLVTARRMGGKISRTRAMAY